METLKSIEERRSIRGFTKEKIKKEIIEDILNCGKLIQMIQKIKLQI